MGFTKSGYLVVIAMLMLTFLPSDSQVEGHLKLLLLLPLILLKLGLAAPIVLLLIAKVILLALKKKAILAALLLSQVKKGGLGGNDMSGEYGSTPDGIGGILGSITSLGRIKRSTDFIQDVIGKIEINEEQLIETILSLDTKRCGEKLLCEVASAQRKRKVNEEEAAVFALFTNKELATKSSSRAIKVYKKALMNGFRAKDCTTRYPSCPFKKSDMIDLVHLITGSEFAEEFFPLVSTNSSSITTSLPVQTQEEIDVKGIPIVVNQKA